jgi:TolB-like protein
MTPSSLLQRLKERKLVQWALAYLAGAWVVVQLLDAVKDPVGLSPVVHRGILAILAVGFLLTLVLAWYHGEKGRQRVSGPELLMVAALLLVAGVALVTLGPEEEGVAGPARALEDDGRTSIAVLPFENFSPAPEDAYFANGMHAEIISALSKISALRVISRNSVMQYQEDPKPTAQIAAELGAEFILTGSATIAGGVVHLTAQLIDGSQDENIWTEEYDKEYSVENLIGVHADLAAKVTNALQATLLPKEAGRIASLPTQDTVAYALYLRTQELDSRDDGESEASIELLHQALRLDPSFAAAYAHLGRRLYQRVQYQDDPDPGAVGDTIIALAQRALDLEPEMADGYGALALGYYLKGHLEQRNRADLRALELDPKNATLWGYVAWDAWEVGKCDVAYEAFKSAATIDPLDWDAMYEAALAAMCLDLDQKAEEWIARADEIPRDEGEWGLAPIFLALKQGSVQDALERAEGWVRQRPGLPIAQDALANVLLAKRDGSGGRPVLEDLYSQAPDWHFTFGVGGQAWFRTSLSWALIAESEEERAREVLAEARAMLEEALLDVAWRPELHAEMAAVHALSGEEEQALARLELVLEAGVGRFPWYFRLDPRFDSLRSHPGFRKFLGEVEAHVEEMRWRVEQSEVDLGIGG